MFENVCFTLDSTECPLRRPRGAYFLDNLLFSEKADSHTVKYELATHPASGLIIWAYGGMFGSLHDSRVLATSGFLRLLHGNAKGVVDKGYIGIDPLRLVVQVKCPSTIHELVWNHCIGSVRAVAEQTNNRLKHLGMFCKPYRGTDLKAHRDDFFNMCQMQNLFTQLSPIRRVLHPLLRSCPLRPPMRLQLQYMD